MNGNGVCYIGFLVQRLGEKLAPTRILHLGWVWDTHQMQHFISGHVVHTFPCIKSVAVAWLISLQTRIDVTKYTNYVFPWQQFGGMNYEHSLGISPFEMIKHFPMPVTQMPWRKMVIKLISSHRALSSFVPKLLSLRHHLTGLLMLLCLAIKSSWNPKPIDLWAETEPMYAWSLESALQDWDYHDLLFFKSCRCQCPLRWEFCG